MEDMLSGLIGGVSKLVGAGVDWYRGDKAAKAGDDRYHIQMLREDNALQRRVQDAKLAGIHPIYALGGSGAASGPYADVGSPASVGADIGAAGQSFGKAMAAYANREERSLLLEGTRLDVEKKKLDNQITRMEIASRVATLSQGAPPPFPTLVTPDGGSGGGTSVKPDTKRTGTNWFGRNASVANMPDAQTMQNRYGEPMEWIYFPFVTAADALVNAWPHLSNFVDRVGLGNPVPGGDWQRTMNKLDRYMRFLNTQTRR